MLVFGANWDFWAFADQRAHKAPSLHRRLRVATGAPWQSHVSSRLVEERIDSRFLVRVGLDQSFSLSCHRLAREVGGASRGDLRLLFGKVLFASGVAGG